MFHRLRIGLLLTTLVVPISATGSGTNETFRPLRASELLGKRIENSEGRELGTLQDLVFDAQKGRLTFAVISSSQLLGLQTRLHPAPAELMSAGTVKKDVLLLDVPLAQWKHAPSFAREDLPFLARPRHHRQIASFFGTRDTRQLANQGSQENPHQPLAPTGRSEPRTHQTNTHSLLLTGDLLLKPVLDRDGNKVGHVQDLLFMFDADQPVLASVEFLSPLASGERSRQIPLRALIPSEKGFTWRSDPEPPRSPGTLSSREPESARLAADGLENDQSLPE